MLLGVVSSERRPTVVGLPLLAVRVAGRVVSDSKPPSE